MRLAFIRKDFDPNGGGVEKYTANIATRLLERGHDLTVFAESFRGELNGGLKWTSVPRRLLPSTSRTTAFHASLRKILDPGEFDLVYALSRTTPCDVFRVSEQVHAEWMPIRYPWYQRFNPRHHGVLRLERAIFRTANTRFVITNSEMVKRQVVGRFGYPEELVEVVRNGVDRGVYRPAAEDERCVLRERMNLSPETFALLFVAGNFKIKGLTSAIRTIASLPGVVKDRVRLLVVGGDDPDPFRAEARRLEVMDKVDFVGRRKNMRDYYAASDLLLFPSLYEPFANVCLEACACGLPVVTTAQNGSCELLENGVNGFVVNGANRVDEMAGHIIDFVGLDGVARAGFSASALKATDAYDWDRHVTRLEEIFQRIVSEREADANSNRTI